MGRYSFLPYTLICHCLKKYIAIFIVKKGQRTISRHSKYSAEVILLLKLCHFSSRCCHISYDISAPRKWENFENPVRISQKSV